MTTHELKCWPDYFGMVLNGVKLFEVRRNDRRFQEGDILRLREWDPGLRVTVIDNANEHGVETEPIGYTGRACDRTIIYILTGGQFGIEPGYVVLGFAGWEKGTAPATPYQQLADFAAWLSIQPGTLKVGSKHESTEILRSVFEYCRQNSIAPN